MIEQLRIKHTNLVKTISPTDGTVASDLVATITLFIKECIETGKHTSNIDDRAELRSMLSHWATFLYETTNETSFLTADIAEPDLGLTNLRLSFEELHSRCQQQARQFVERRVAEGVFDPEHVVSRVDAEKLLSEFLQGDRSGLVITGDSGVGKTFLICQLASRDLGQAGEEATLVLPYDCQKLGWDVSPLDKALREAVEGQLAQDLGITADTSFEAGLVHMEGLLRQRNTHLLVCFDAVESFKVSFSETATGFQEVLRVKEFLHSLNALIKSIRMNGVTRIKFLFTSVQAVWKSFNLDRTLSWGQFLAPNPETRSLGIGNFSDPEFNTACRAYGIPEESIKTFKDLTESNPYMLRLASERCAELKDLSSDIAAQKELLFREYYTRRILGKGTSEEIELKQVFLKEFAKRVKPVGKNGYRLLGVPSGDTLLSDSTYELLKADGIIAQELIMDPFPELVIRLNPPKLAEFIKEWYLPGQTLEHTPESPCQ